jgi:hypothetical protein
MNMHNPPHPSEFIDDVYMQPYNLSRRALATHLNAVGSTDVRFEWDTTAEVKRCLAKNTNAFTSSTLWTHFAT